MGLGRQVSPERASLMAETLAWTRHMQRGPRAEETGIRAIACWLDRPADRGTGDWGGCRRRHCLRCLRRARRARARTR